MSDQNDSTDYSVSEIRFTWRVFANSKDEASAFLQERIDEDADFDGAVVDNITGYVKRAYCYCTWLVPEDELTALRRDLETANARAAQAERERDAADRFYVYRKDDYEPGGLEYWNAFETLEQAQQEIENGLKYQDMSIYRSHNNVLIEFMVYEHFFNIGHTEVVYGWKVVDTANATAADGGAEWTPEIGKRVREKESGKRGRIAFVNGSTGVIVVHFPDYLSASFDKDELELDI